MGSPVLAGGASDRRRSPNWRAAVGLTLAGVAAFAAATAVHLPEAMWSVMTALIVVRARPGRALHAGRDRLLATLCGASIALAAVWLRRWQVPDLALVGLCLAAASSLAAWKPAFGAAPIAAIIVLSGDGTAHAPLGIALLRVAEITIGALVGYGVSRLLPARFMPTTRRG